MVMESEWFDEKEALRAAKWYLQPMLEITCGDNHILTEDIAKCLVEYYFGNRATAILETNGVKVQIPTDNLKFMVEIYRKANGLHEQYVDEAINAVPEEGVTHDPMRQLSAESHEIPTVSVLSEAEKSVRQNRLRN